MCSTQSFSPLYQITKACCFRHVFFLFRKCVGSAVVSFFNSSRQLERKTLVVAMGFQWLYPLFWLLVVGNDFVTSKSNDGHQNFLHRYKRAERRSFPGRPMEVVGGIKPGPRLFPHMALLKYKDQFVCAGSLVSPRHVLTTFYCVLGDPANTFTVVLGEYQRSASDGTEQILYVSDTIIHPFVDVAILVLSKDAIINSAVKPIGLARELPAVGSLVTTSGWGWTRHETEESESDYLQYINLAISNSTVCSEEISVWHPYEICIGNSTGDYANACYGDNGSPVIYPAFPSAEPVQVAMVTAVPVDCPKSSKYAVSVSIPTVYSWIMDNVGCALPGSWTTWLNRDSPSKNGDFETVALHKPCGQQTPVCYEYRVASTIHCKSPHSDCAGKKYQRIKHSRADGLVCENRLQRSISKCWWLFGRQSLRCRCCDYAIRFKCPA